MAEKKKLSVAEMMAAARKSDGKGGAPSSPEAAPAAESPAAPAPETAPLAEPVAAAEAAPVEKPAEKPKPAASPKPAAAGGARPSMAEMLAMARAQGAGKPAEKAAPAAEAPKPDAPKPAKESPKPKPAAKVVAAESKSEGLHDTTSILSGGPKKDKAGPVSKSEAPAPAKEAPAAVKPAKTKPVAPPMPEKPAAAKPKAAKGADQDRRGFMTLILGTFLGIGLTAMSATFGLWTLALARFMFPNVRREPPSRFKVGFKSDFPPGKVEEKYKAQFGVWVVNGEYNGQQQIYALSTVCTHLGCTPNWLESEQKYKCPCHGSGFYKDGINFEGPAPRPLERYAIRIADDGQLEIDKSKKFQEEMGQWSDGSSFVNV